MKQKTKRIFAWVLALCMILGSVQLPAAAVRAAAADGEIDTSEEGYQTVRYFTGADTEITSAQTKSERVSDFFAGTESMVWSVEFKTTESKLQALMVLEYGNSKYMSFFLRDSNKLGLETKDGTNAGPTAASVNYNDGQWHTAKLELTKSRGVKLYLDDVVVVQTDSAPTCISDLSWTPDTFTIGGMTNYSGKSGWTFNGTMRNVVLKKKVALPAAEPDYRAANPGIGSEDTGIDGGLSQGTVSLTYRLKEAGAKRVSLLGLGSDGEIWLDTAEGKVGIQTGDVQQEMAVSNTKLDTVKWHNLAACFADGSVDLYVDGVLAGSKAYTGTPDVSQVTYGSDIYYSKAEIYTPALDEERITELQAATAYPDGTEKMEGYVKTENREVFNSGYDGSVAYRIPGIVVSEKTGTVITSIDKRWDHSGDVGKIDTVIRRSEDNGKTWSPVIPVIDMPDADAYTVDPSLAVDNDPESPYYGRIYCLVDMYPYNIGLWASEPGTGYREVDGVMCRVLYDSADNEYIMKPDGKVYDSDGNLTEYEVETEAAAPYKDMGALYRNGERIGSIYKNSDLAIYETTYLWVSYSDDDGLTWSLPKDITPEVKDDWMRFHGTGPGHGIQLQNGRIMFPTYCSHAAQSSALSSLHVYTDDGGATWHRGASPNDVSETSTAANSTRQLNENTILQLDNGHLIQFMKNSTANVAMAVSTDNGASWGEVTYAAGIPEPYCNLTSLHYPGKIVDPRDGQAKEAIIFANPRGTTTYSGQGREGGTVRIAFVNADDTLDWAYSKLIEENKFIYCSIAALNNGDIAMIYEHEGYAMIGAAYTSFSPQYIMDSNAYENTPAPKAIRTEIVDADGQPTSVLRVGNKVNIDVTFSQKVFAAGNVTLNVQVGDARKEAVLAGNIADDKLRFVYTVQEGDDGKMIATSEVNVKKGGAAETIYNVSLTDKPIVTQNAEVGKIFRESPFAELPTTGMSATAGSAYAGTTEGPASNVLDGNLNTHWHSNYANNVDNVSNGGRPKHYVTIDLGGSRLVSGLTYTPRTGGMNGCVTEYQIEVSTNGTDFVPVATGTWIKNSEVKTADLGGAALASHVRFRVLDTGDEWASAAEIRIIGSSDTAAATDKTALLAAIMEAAVYAEKANALDENGTFTAVLADARTKTAGLQTSTEELAAAAQALHEATAELAAKARTMLAAEIGKAQARNEENYNLSSWKAYEKALQAAEAVSAESTDKEVLDAYCVLTEAGKNLAFSAAGNTALLEEMKAEANTVLAQEKEKIDAGQGDYSEESWKAYQQAYERLENVAANASGATEVKQYMNMLAEAKLSLKKVQGIGQAQKNAQDKLDEHKAVLDAGRGDYTEDSWNAFVNAYNSLKDAVEVSGDTEQLADLTLALQSAYDALTTETQKEQAEARKAAEDAWNGAKSLADAGRGNYTEASWNAFKAAYDKLAQAVNDASSDADTLKALTAALESAKKALTEEKPVTDEKLVQAKAQAQTALDDAKKILDAGRGNYTEASWNAWKAAYDKLALAVKNNASADVLNTLTAQLKAAKNALTQKTPDEVQKIQQGSTYKVKNLKYKVTSVDKKTVTLTGTASKNIKNLKVPATVTINGVKCKVTAIGAKAFKNCKKLKMVNIGANVTNIGKQAFAGCKNLKKITVKSKKLKKVGAKALKGIHKKAVIKVPRAKRANYRKTFAKKGQPKTVKIR